MTGSVVATQKHPRFERHRLLTVDRIGTDGASLGRTEDVALDAGLDAGAGDVVLVVKEGAVVADVFDRDAEGAAPTPANVVIVAVVDDWTAREG